MEVRGEAVVGGVVAPAVGVGGAGPGRSFDGGEGGLHGYVLARRAERTISVWRRRKAISQSRRMARWMGLAASSISAKYWRWSSSISS